MYIALNAKEKKILFIFTESRDELSIKKEETADSSYK